MTPEEVRGKTRKWDGFDEKATELQLLEKEETHPFNRRQYVGDDECVVPDSYVKYMIETFTPLGPKATLKEAIEWLKESKVPMENAIAFMGPPPKAEDLPTWLTKPLPEAPFAECEPQVEALIVHCQQNEKLIASMETKDLRKWFGYFYLPKGPKPKGHKPYIHIIEKPKGLDLKRAASSTVLLVPDQLGNTLLELLTHPLIQEVTINEKGARLTWHVLQILLLSAKKYAERYGADPTTALPFLKAGKSYETKEEVVAAVTDLVFHGERYRQSAPIISFTTTDLRHHNAKFRGYRDKQFQEMVDEANAVSLTYKTARIELPGKDGERYYILPGKLVTIVTEVQEREKLRQGQRTKKETIWHLVCKDPFTLSFLNDIHKKCVQLLPSQFNELSGTGQELLMGCLWSARNPNYFGLRQARKMCGWKKPKNAPDATEQIHQITKLLEEAVGKKVIKRNKVTGLGEKTKWFVWK